MKNTCFTVLLYGLLAVTGVAAAQAAAPPAGPAESGACRVVSDETGTVPGGPPDGRTAGGGNAAGMSLPFFVFVLAMFLGFELIAKVPSQLHTPLMSGSNAISGISVVGALIAAGRGHGAIMTVLGTLAVALAMINVVGGYLVTDRMLGMFQRRD